MRRMPVFWRRAAELSNPTTWPRFIHTLLYTSIKAVALSMKASLRREDLCARWGGEEFLICLPSIEPQSAAVAAEKIRSGVESLIIEYDGEKLSTSISIGVAHYRAEVDLDALIRDADQAMIASKRAGKNRVVDVG